jgi:hypothetical protein
MENFCDFTLLEQMCSNKNVLIIDVSNIWVLHIYLSDFDVYSVKIYSWKWDDIILKLITYLLYEWYIPVVIPVFTDTGRSKVHLSDYAVMPSP